jgi:hypothetical protein
MRRSTLFVVCMASAVGFGLFQLKYEVMKLENQHKHVRRSIKNTHEAISILNAEWSHLTSPDRLQKLAEKHLAIEPVSGSQMISLRNVPVHSYPDEAATTQNRFALDQLVSAVLTDNDILPEDDGHDE